MIFYQHDTMGPYVFLLALTILHRSHASINFDQSLNATSATLLLYFTFPLARMGNDTYIEIEVEEPSGMVPTINNFYQMYNIIS